MPSNKSSDTLPFAEVIEAESTQFKAQCWKWDVMPCFGQMVTVNSNKLHIIGCVTSIKTGSIDSMHTPTAYGLSEEKLRQEQPQIFELLKTCFDVHVMGYFEKKATTFNPSIPPFPARIHRFVQNISICNFGSIITKADNLKRLITAPLLTNIKIELLTSVLSQFAQLKQISEVFLEEFYMLCSECSDISFAQIRMLFKHIEKNLKTDLCK